MNRRRNILILAGAVLAVILIGVFAARGQSATAVRETTIHYATFQTKLPETGTVQLPQIVTLPAGVGGNIGSIFVKAGDTVVRGSLLGTISNTQIVTNLSDAAANAESAHGHAQTAGETAALLPEQNRAAVLQAQANLVAANSQLAQARGDLTSGSQSGLGYGGNTAEEQRIAADATLAKATSDLSEAKRLYDADKYIYSQKGISTDSLMQSKARYDTALVTYEQALSERRILTGTLERNAQVLKARARSAQDSVAQAQAALASARTSAAQSKTGDLEAARADAARADADLAYAQDQASKLQIHAPFDGVILTVANEAGDTLRPLQPGDQVTPGQGLFVMSENRDFIVRTRVDEQDVANLKVGQHAVISGEDFNGAKLTGHVVAISPIAQKSDDPSNTSRQVVTTIALDKRLPFLRDGMTVDVDIYTHDEPHTLAVPSDALRKDDKGNYLFVVRDGKARRTNVKIGAQNDTQTVILTGLRDGDVVVSEKNPDISDGSNVKPAPSPTPLASGASPEPT